MPSWTRRNFLKTAVAFTLAGELFLEACKRRKKTLNVLNWAGYIAKAPLEKFERETGVVINYDVYFAEEDLLAKLEAKTAFDVAVVPGYLIPILKETKLIAPLRHSELHNLSNLEKRFTSPGYDPGLTHSVPYLWGITGIGFNTAHFPSPPVSWEALWDSRCRGRITMLDDAREAIQCALLLAGLPRETKNPADLEKAKALLIKQRPLVKSYNSSTYGDDLAAGEIWLSQAWNGDVVQSARVRKTVGFTIPKEGGFLWIDNLCLTEEGAGNPVAAKFINFMLDGQIAAETSNAVRYATANQKALPLLDPVLRFDVRIFPLPEDQARLLPPPVLDSATDQLWRDLWLQIKSA